MIFDLIVAVGRHRILTTLGPKQIGIQRLGANETTMRGRTDTVERKREENRESWETLERLPAKGAKRLVV